MRALSLLYQSALSDHTHGLDLRKQINDAFLALGFKDGSYDLKISSSAFLGSTTQADWVRAYARCVMKVTKRKAAHGKVADWILCFGGVVVVYVFA